MTEQLITPVILCGGSGTRLWPLSRKSYPKQFSAIVGDKSLFQDCAMRMTGPNYAPPVVMTGEDFRFIVTQQLQAIKCAPAMVMVEPDPRDTAPAILAAALAGQLVTFGINPERPEEGYGYLEVREGEGAIRTLKRFVEKPDCIAAKEMLTKGNYLWNAGLFLFTARNLLSAFDRYAPDMRSAVASALRDGKSDLGFFRLDAGHWSTVKATSIDYAIMEKAPNLSVAPYGESWSDLGDWAAVWRETEKSGVALLGDATAIDCENVLLRSEVEGQSIVGIGLQDIVAIAMPDAVLISHKDRAQDVKIAVQQLKSNGVVQAEVFPKDHRPWGWFESLATGDRFQVKRIVVNPDAALSLQSHHHRSEHWIVVAGTAKVTVGNNVELVTENQSIYIPLGTCHRLENPGKVPMVLIEVQTGAYLGEDDIVRHEDAYARC